MKGLLLILFAVLTATVGYGQQWRKKQASLCYCELHWQEKYPPLKRAASLNEGSGIYIAAEGFVAKGGRWGGLTEAGYRFSNYMAVGAGSGYARYTEEYRTGNIIPLFVSLRTILFRSVLSPYITAAGGINFEFYTNTDYYLAGGHLVVGYSKHIAAWGYYHAGAGLHLRCSPSFALYAGAAYNNITEAPAITMGLVIRL